MLGDQVSIDGRKVRTLGMGDYVGSILSVHVARVHDKSKRSVAALDGKVKEPCCLMALALQLSKS